VENSAEEVDVCKMAFLYLPRLDLGLQASDDNDRGADLEQLMAAGGVPGLSIGIVRDGDIVSTIAEGVRNATSGDRVDDGTVFEAASLTKPVFAYVFCS
jgi:CubicO group peptidase (beta-lactamase class C family)